jgi:hypothetical protein
METLAPKAGRLLGLLRWIGGLLVRLPRPVGFVLPLIWYRAIWALSSMEGKDSSSSFGWSWLLNSGHAPLFGFVAFLALVGLPRVRGSWGGWPQMRSHGVLFILALVLALGVLDEWHQSKVALRDSSLLDILTDLTGAGCTLWIASYLGQSEASESGLRVRLCAGLVLCAGVGLLGVL